MAEGIRPNWDQEPQNEVITSRFYGVLISGAVGDSFGMPIEGWKRAQISKYIGELNALVDPQELYSSIQASHQLEADFPARFTTRAILKGTYTDDTHLTIAVGRAVASNGFNLEAVGREHVVLSRELEADKRDTWESFGKTTTQAIENLKKGISPTESAASEAPGNAPALKMGPIGMHMYKKNAYEEGLKFAQAVGKMTHKYPASIAAGVAQAQGVYSMLAGVTRRGFVDSILNATRPFQSLLTQPLQWVKENPDATLDEAYNVLGSTFSVESNYPMTIFMVQKYWDSPFEGLIKAVNMGGDADSIGAMYGTLAGARNKDFIPQSWKDEIKDREELQKLAQSLGR